MLAGDGTRDSIQHWTPWSKACFASAKAHAGGAAIMMGGFRNYASKGPAKVLAFPFPTVRAWYVREFGDNRWRGDLIGGRDLLDDGPMMTESGPLDLVMNALKAGPVRQGLPIIVLRTAPRLKGRAG